MAYTQVSRDNVSTPPVSRSEREASIDVEQVFKSTLIQSHVQTSKHGWIFKHKPQNIFDPIFISSYITIIGTSQETLTLAFPLENKGVHPFRIGERIGGAVEILSLLTAQCSQCPRKRTFIPVSFSCVYFPRVPLYAALYTEIEQKRRFFLQPPPTAALKMPVGKSPTTHSERRRWHFTALRTNNGASAARWQTMAS